MSTIRKIVRSYCNGCQSKTNQAVLFAKRIYHTTEKSVGDKLKTKDSDTFMIIQCKGCNEISYLTRLTGEVFIGLTDDDDYLDINYPESDNYLGTSLLRHEDQKRLPRQVYKLYDEIESAFRNESNILAGVGLRMLVESLCIDQGIRGSNLKEKIEQLHRDGLISKNEIPILDKLREIGNSSAHEIKSFPLTKLEYALDIINHVLKSIYILPIINKKLKL